MDFQNLNKKSLIVFGADKGMGLTTTTLRIANSLALKEKVCFISYQDHKASLQRKLRDCGEEPENLLKLEDGVSFMEPCFISELTQLIQQNQYSTIFIDSLDYLNGDDPAMNQFERDYLVVDLKGLVDLFGCTIILNVWLSDQLENRGGDHRPKYRDIVWCRKLSALADQIFAIYRPVYYGMVQDENGDDIVNMLEIISLKDESGSEVSIKYAI